MQATLGHQPALLPDAGRGEAHCDDDGVPAVDIDFDYGKLRYKAWLLPPLLTEHSVLYSPKHAPQLKQSTTCLLYTSPSPRDSTSS
eukprot:8731986-Prorocentrum_lima.AAC.1